jgi:hypothetical protein
MALSLGALVLFVVIVGMYDEITYSGIVNAAAGVFALYAVILLTVFLFKGLKRDDVSPPLTLAPQEVKTPTFEAAVVEWFAHLMARSRQPLPPPVGLLAGPSSDPMAIRLLSREQAESIAMLYAIGE